MPQVKVHDNEDITEDSVATTLRRALSFYSTLQNHDGHWAGDYGGPMFLMPGMVNVSIAATSCLTFKKILLMFYALELGHNFYFNDNFLISFISLTGYCSICYGGTQCSIIK